MPKRPVRRATRSATAAVKPETARRTARGVGTPRDRGATAVAAEPPFDPEVIHLICRSGADRHVVSVRSGAALRRAAMEWTYIVRNRRRWANVDSVVADQSKRIRSLAERLDLAPSALDVLGNAEVIEVEVPYEHEEKVWEGRVFPWEHVLAAGTREIRNGRALTVVRRLRRSTPPAAAATKVRNVLFVEATPGSIGEDYSFDAERTLVKDTFEPMGAKVVALPKATLASIAAAVAKHRPEIVHFAGCDTHQAAELLEQKDPGHDGLCLDGEDGRPYHATPLEIAHALRHDGTPPLLVSFNLFNSASRTAALAVAEGGAGAAIGFQDYFSERFAEEFFAKLYWAIRESGTDVLAAFRFAWAEIRNRLAATAGTAGTGVVLWGAHSWLGSGSALLSAAPQPLREKEEKERMAPLDIRDAAVAASVKLRIEPHAELNYSILHNGRSLFKTFQVSKPLGRLDDFNVSVRLNAGQEQIPFEQTFKLSEKTAELSKDILVPLTSTLMRSLRESVRSTVRVEVTCGNSVLHRETKPVNLLAIDEWKDDDDNRVWLPSFVLPRDPAVLRIVDAAQKYLCALKDDASAGFDGYQSVDKASDAPYLGVDQQVQAIWWAIVADFHPSYVNPPPTYTGASQRLRTPTDVIDGRRGTCIDLALLFAACLEYVDVYPALFLLEGHAFPAYWRSDEFYEDFRKVRAPESVEPAPDAPGAAADDSQAQSPGWYLQKSVYSEILQTVRAGDLVPIETVFLTSRSSFAEALDEGLANLRSRAEFNSMLDVRRAREAGVTPLPFRGVQS